jgi:hypothetical protein
MSELLLLPPLTKFTDMGNARFVIKLTLIIQTNTHHHHSN